MGQINSGPIPGANMTGDTKNLPWHQPPKFTDIDDAMDYIADKLTKFPVANGFLTMSEIGLPIVKQVELFLMQGVSQGFWTLDYAILLAGPVARLVELLHIGFHIPYVMGYEQDPNDFDTGEFFKGNLNLQNLAHSGSGMKVMTDGLDAVKQAADNQTPVPDSSLADGGQGDDALASSPSPDQAPPTSNLQQQGFMAMSAQPQKGAKQPPMKGNPQ